MLLTYDNAIILFNAMSCGITTIPLAFPICGKKAELWVVCNYKTGKDEYWHVLIEDGEGEIL